MSNSIWHKASEKPELNKYVIVRKHGFAQWKVFKFDNKTTFFEPFTGDLWAYMADVITQADKVELQADKAERLHAKLRTIAYMEQRLCIDDPVNILDDVLKIAKDEIKQLIKEN